MITLKDVNILKGQPNQTVPGVELYDLIGREFSSLKRIREVAYEMLPRNLKGCQVEYVVLFADGSTRKFVK